MRFLQASFRQIYHIVLGFPFHIAGAIATSRDEQLLRILVHNLYAEVGEAGGEAHITIYRRLLHAVGESAHRPCAEELWDETVALESTCARLYRSSDVGVKLGSLYAFELMSAPMVEKWDRAMRSSTSLAPRDFEFFTIHIDIEKDHVDDIARCAAHHWATAGFAASFVSSSQEVMLALEKFWDRVAETA
ncbi:MAG: iron-containing redox enzyme family protein [Phycisphaerales bacterium]